MSSSGFSQFGDFARIKGQASLAALFSKEAFVNNPWKLRVQWHVWSDGQTVISAIRQGDAWFQGPTLSVSDLGNQAIVRDHAYAVRGKYARNGVMGVFYHVADEFTTTTIKPEFSGAQAFPKARAILIDNPAMVVEERVAAKTSYGVVPLNHANKSVGIKLSAERFRAFDGLAGEAPDLRIAVYSAPMELLANLPWLEIGEAMEALSESPLVIVLAYRAYSVIAIVTKIGLVSLSAVHASDPELIRRIEVDVSNVGLPKFNAMWIDNTDLSPEVLNERIARLFGANPSLGEKCDSYLNVSASELASEIAHLSGGQSPVRLEFFQESKRASDLFQGEGATRRMMDAAHINFSTTANLVSQNRISPIENTAILASRAVSGLFVIGFLAAVGWMGWGVYEALRSPSWLLNEEVAQKTGKEAVRLRSVEASVDQWTKFMIPRSQAWAAMEFANALFPEATGIQINSLRYICEPAREPLPTPGAQPVGINLARIWEFRGEAPVAAVAYLDSLNAEAARSALKKVADIAKEPSWEAAKGTVEIRVDRRDSGPSTDRTLPIAFTLSVQQVTDHAVNLPASLPPLPPLKDVMRESYIPSL